ncbi:MAG: branched-chain amino acid ABC transporter permease [Pigmentiphaga sp.]|uniref:branched-chain amino acid ABC transporter permease n=1 Tax=Pigmentiphaga sp. TaxID=1977564 RepID=UPI003B538102
MNRWFLLLPLGLLSVAFLGLGDYYLNFIVRILIASILAMSLNLLVGYGGLMSLGHSAFFGIAGYAVAWLSVEQGWPPALAVPAALGLVALSAACFGAVSLRARGIGFMMITLALGQMVWGLAVRWVDVTGGDNGIRGLLRPRLPGMDLDDPTQFYLLVAAIFLAVCLLVWRIVRSPYGASLMGARDQPRRMSALGYDVWMIRWSAFVLAAVFAGVAGILDAYHHKFVSPEIASLSTSAQALLMVIVGGSSVLLGPAVGAAVVLVFTQVMSFYVERWTALLGVMFVLIVLFMPDGLIPGLRRLRARWYGGRSGPDDKQRMWEAVS